MIETKHLKKSYHAKTEQEIKVINDTTLSLPDVGLVSLLGASGSGKTTLLNVIGGLDKPDSGTIVYDDVSFERYSMRKVDAYRSKNISYIFQNYNLLQEKTIWENMEIALEIMGITDEEEVQKRIEYTLKSVGLYKFRRKLAKALSGGQMQRVSIARALLKNAKLIIADEPTGNLDSQNTLEVMNILKKISKNNLILLVTHDKNLAEYYSDLIIELKDGSINATRQTDQTVSLDKKHHNNVYLLDLNHSKQESEKVTIDFYHEAPLEPLDLFIYVQNGTYYLKSQKNIKMLDDSGLTVLNEHFEEKKAEDIEFHYDTTWYDDTKKSGRGKWLKNECKSSFYNFFHTSKKNKFFNFVFLLIGLIIGIMNVIYVSYATIDTSSMSTDPQLLSLSLDQTYRADEYNQAVEEALQAGMIKDILPRVTIQTNVDYSLSLNFTYTASVFTAYYPLKLIEANQISIGSMPNNISEIVIGNLLADQIIKEMGIALTQQELIGLKLGDYTICGIVQNKALASYGDDYESCIKEDINSNNTVYAELYSTNPKELIDFFKEKNLKVDFHKKLMIEDAKQGQFEIRMVMLGVLIALFLASCIYIYFSMRAMMISDIYDIGVYRCLGYKRTHICLKYVMDIIIRVTFTCLLGYLLFTLVYGFISYKLVSLGAVAPLIHMNASTYLCMLLIYILNILFGCLPILLLLRKTPAEIITKYDI